jgi:hypothetical protein
MNNKNRKVSVERVLVQGSAEFKISCNDLMGLVTKEQAADDDYMKEWFRTEAYRMIAGGYSSDSEAEFENEIDVKVSEETASKLTGKIISNQQWDEVRKESKSLE